MKKVIVALAALFLVFLSGCAQTGAPADCSGVPPAKFSNCLYVKAVMEQNPFRCYSLSDLNQRAQCIKDASNQEARSSLQRALPEQRDSIFADNVAAPAKENKTEPPPAEAQRSPPAAPLEQCNLLASQDRDNCLRALAVENKVIATCTGISDETVRQNCITQIAKMVKDPSICAPLGKQADRDLCNLYAKAGEG